MLTFSIIKKIIAKPTSSFLVVKIRTQSLFSCIQMPKHYFVSYQHIQRLKKLIQNAFTVIFNLKQLNFWQMISSLILSFQNNFNTSSSNSTVPLLLVPPVVRVLQQEHPCAPVVIFTKTLYWFYLALELARILLPRIISYNYLELILCYSRGLAAGLKNPLLQQRIRSTTEKSSVIVDDLQQVTVLRYIQRCL